MPSQPKQNRGFSLVIVLAAVALLIILMVAFLSSVSTDLQSSKVYSSGSALRLLSESAANLAIGQIRVATSDASLCWASQPGMIRTFNTSGPAGYYKLYSDSAMQGTGAFDPNASANAVPTNWYSQKGVYVDLNQPVTIGSTNYFPIMDGDAADLVDVSPVFDISGTSKGIGPLNGTQPTVEGFWLKGNTPVDASTPNKAPMPVKWLYVLQDGKVIVPTSGNISGTVTFDPSGAQPSASNRIVGRIAFWTDDETCKVNVNTASEGTYWDSPMTYTYQDCKLATSQPVQGEFQRYPGHPAQVSLSSVLGVTTGSVAWSPYAPFSHEDIFPLSPYTKAGGSAGGTIDTTFIYSATSAAGALAQSVNRLYTSVDEFMFQPTLSGSNRLQNSALLTNQSALDADALKKARFFLTVNSTAPDVNVFNLPRVSMWPITLNAAGSAQATTALDKLIAFCSTLNNGDVNNSRLFYFQRQDPNSSTVDLPSSAATTGVGRNRALLEYVRGFMNKPFPGFGIGKFMDSAKYGVDDSNQIVTEIFDYIRSTNLQDSNSGATTYTASFDNTSASTSYLGGKGQVVPIVDNTLSVVDTVSGSTSSPRGFGRFPAVQQAAIVFIGVADSGTTPAYVPAFTGTYPGFAGSYATLSGTLASSGTMVRVQPALVLQMFNPALGVATTYPWYEVEVEGANNVFWSNAAGTSYPMFSGVGAVSLGQPYTGKAGTSQNFYGGINDFRQFTYQKGNPNSANKYPLVGRPTGAVDAGGAPVNCPDITDGFVYLKDSTITVKVWALKANRTRSDLISTTNIKFPATKFVAPVCIRDTVAAFSPYVSSRTSINLRTFYDDGGYAGRFNMLNNVSWLGSKDSVRAVVATPGDMRLVAARGNVPNSFFGPITGATTDPANDYFTSSVRSSHMLRFGLAFAACYGAGGKLVNVNYSGYMPNYNLWGSSPYNDFETYQKVNPDGSNSSSTWARTKDTIVPTQTVNVQTQNGVQGDWDNGLGNSVDGPYINKADEGDSGNGSGNIAYFDMDYGPGTPGPTFFTANRMIPSPGVLGSLPSGVWANKPWQTLLFRPGPANHPGLTSPPDHLLMDLFNMPVVEPYAITTPLATAGRINMNYQIVPFTYIHRDTGLRAAMKAQMMTVIASPGGTNLYKSRQNPQAGINSGGSNLPSAQTVRYPINADLTLSQFQSRFNSGDIFRSASEICSIDLVPSGNLTGLPSSLPITRAAMDAFWRTYILTGDNARERPYTLLYPLLTTKSNTYTVHMRVQTLKQVPTGNNTYTTWREGKDQVTGQYRGTQLVERYIDAKDTLPDYAADPTTSDTLSQHYKFRTLANRQFAP